jgi:glycosyltransferase involved in cell wall biosynthesis
VKTDIQVTGLSNDITLVGHRSDLREIMAISDVVVSLSTDPEAFGRVSLEALALGKPVAGYAHGGVAEQLSAIFPDGKIFLGDTTAMADLLSRWHQQMPVPRQENPFTLDSMLRATTRIYSQLHSNT